MPRSEVLATLEILATAFRDRTFTTTDAAHAGVPDHRLRAALRSGGLVRLRRGAYRLPPDVAGQQHRPPPRIQGNPSTSDGEDGTTSAALPGLSLSDSLRLCDRLESLGEAGIPAYPAGRTAVGLWGINLWGVRQGDLPTVVVPRGSTRRGPVAGVRIIERDVDDPHVAVIPGPVPLRAVDPLLAVLHVAADRHVASTPRIAMLTSGIRRQIMMSTGLPPTAGGHHLAAHLSDSSVHAAVMREATQRILDADVRGRPRLLAAIATVDPRLETILECISWSRFAEAGIELPVPQVELRGASGARWRVDFLFGRRVIGECDGAVKYSDSRALWREKKRQEDLEQVGYVVVRWTWEEILHHPEVVIARIMLAISRADSLSQQLVRLADTWGPR